MRPTLSEVGDRMETSGVERQPESVPIHEAAQAIPTDALAGMPP